MSWEAELGFALDLADRADDITLAAFRDARTESSLKADGTVVTEADRQVEQVLRRAIRDRFPQHAVLGEEEGLDGPEDAPTWIIDPVDGTTNFTKGNPIFATLIALRVEGSEVLGVVTAPALGSRWTGLQSGPATHNGVEIRVSDVSSLAEAEVAFGGLNYFERRGALPLVEELSKRTKRQRGYGDFWQHCLVASGSTDVALEAEVNLWDLAAVKAVVEAAGGRFTDLAGRPTADGGSAISSNGILHDEVLSLVADTT